jgi:ribosomal-protein-alanine N-acetyltransferase
VPDQPILTTNRLTLRPFRLDDAWDVERLAGMREIADTTLNIPHPYPVGAANAWIQSHPPAWAGASNATFAIVETKTGKLVGAISLMIKREHRRGELGYWIARDRWNNGYATEASQRVVDFGFESLGLHRIEARHFLRNPECRKKASSATGRSNGTGSSLWPSTPFSKRSGGGGGNLL